ncbi:50S ribosomal protein L16, partial [Salmonella enterica]|uniref:50S ribosomal protein L16 n=1 Tax=Salmonella enterica TaxID=28901 RepID=UPI00398C3C22
MLQPERTKCRKMHKGRNRGLAAGADVSFGSFGLKAVGRCRLTARQIEAARRPMTRPVKPPGYTRIRVFPDKPSTRKQLSLRVGPAKGKLLLWFSVSRSGS